MTNVKIVPTDAVASPVVVDLTGPEADAPAILRFLASPSFDAALVKVAQAAVKAERDRLFAWAEEEMVDVYAGIFETGDVRFHKGREATFTALAAQIERVPT